jgi:hypothetical protein
MTREECLTYLRTGKRGAASRELHAASAERGAAFAQKKTGPLLPS